MKTVYKYPIRITDKQLIAFPENAEIKHVGLDPNGVPCLWIELDTKQPDQLRDLYIVGTGRPIPEEATKHIGSFVQDPFVWHAYL